MWISEIQGLVAVMATAVGTSAAAPPSNGQAPTPKKVAVLDLATPGLGDAAGKVLTDDFAPVETLRAIEKNNEKWKEQTEAPR